MNNAVNMIRHDYITNHIFFSKFQQVEPVIDMIIKFGLFDKLHPPVTCNREEKEGVSILMCNMCAHSCLL